MNWAVAGCASTVSPSNYRDPLAHVSQLFPGWQELAKIQFQDLCDSLKLMKWHLLPAAFKVGHGGA